MTAYVDTIGFELDLTVVDEETEAAIDISPANGALTIDVRKPDDSVVTWTPTVVNGISGIAQYVTVDGDLDQAGTYSLQLNWNPTSPGQNYWSTKFRLTVRERVVTCH